MRKAIKLILVVSLLMSILSSNNTLTTVEAGSINSLTSEEKTVFNSLYSDTSSTSLDSVNVEYSAKVVDSISGYHWTVWKETAKNDGFDKSYNSGKGIGSGNYTGFTASTVKKWDSSYASVIKSYNNGQYPSTQVTILSLRIHQRIKWTSGCMG